MFFTHLGTVVAILALIFGIFSITMGVLAITSPEPFTAERPGPLIDRGIIMVLGSIVLGILTEIRRALQRGSDAP